MFKVQYKGYDLDKSYIDECKIYYNTIKAQFDNSFNIKFNVNFKYYSGFIYHKETDKWFYFSGENNKHVLIRTAQNDRDFTGGPNSFYDLEDIHKYINRITNTYNDDKY